MTMRVGTNGFERDGAKAPVIQRVMLALLTATTVFAVAPSHGIEAQEAQWVETVTPRFLVLTDAADEADASAVAGRAEALYGGLSAAFGAELPAPIGLRVHPTVDSYLRANPLVVESDGVLAGTRKGRREIEVVLPLANHAGANGLDNALRREISRLLAAALSEQEMPEGLLQGVALYMEEPDDSMAAGVASLRGAFSYGALLGLAGLAAPGAVYVDPAVGQAESRAFIQFLVDTRGFGALTSWLSAMTHTNGWRQAMEVGIGSPPEALGAEFETWLPTYLDGGWRAHSMYSGDLATFETMVSRGEYDAAKAHVEAVRVLADGSRADVSERAVSLLLRAETGKAAGEKIQMAIAAMHAGDYATAAAASTEARDAYMSLGNSGQVSTADEVARRARLGSQARQDLLRSDALPPYRVIEARMAAGEAAQVFAAIGDDVSRRRALENITRLDRRLVPAAWLLVVMGAGLLAWNVRGRLRDRREQLP